MRNDRNKRSGGSRGDSRKRPASGRSTFRKRDDREGGEGAKPFGDKTKRPFFKKEDKSGGERSRSYGDKPKRDFGKRDDKGGDEKRRSYGDKPARNFSDKPFEKREGGSRPYPKKNKFKKRDGRVQKRDAYFDKQRVEKLASEKGKAPFAGEKSFEKDKRYQRTEKRKRIGSGEERREERKPFEAKRFPAKRFTKESGEKDKPFDKTKSERFGRGPTRDSERVRPWNRKEDHQFYGERKRSKTPLPKTPDDGSVRLNKYIANAGICSRREADELIAAGVVSVNGKVITEMGYKVMPGDSVKYNNELLRSEQLVYILLNKPKDFITTTDDPENRKTVMSLIAKAGKERVYPVGRLDRNTTGVLLFTNDGDLAKKLTHPSFEVHKVYQVELDRPLKMTDMQQVADGIRLDDGLIKVDEIVYTSADKNVVGVELHSGKNRIVRRIFEHLGYEVKKLDRVVFAGLTKKDLPRGRWRFLSEMEVANLKMITGKKAVRV